MLYGEKAKRCELSRVLQRVYKNTARASSAVVAKLNASAGLDVTAFSPRRAEFGTAGTIDIEKIFPHSGEDVAFRHRAGHWFGGGKGAGAEATRGIPGRCRHSDITPRS